MAVINGKQFKLCLDAITAMPSYTFAQLHGSNQDAVNAVKTKVNLSIVVNYTVCVSLVLMNIQVGSLVVY